MTEYIRILLNYLSIVTFVLPASCPVEVTRVLVSPASSSFPSILKLLPVLWQPRKGVCHLDVPSRKTLGCCSKEGRELTASSHWHWHNSPLQAALRQGPSVMGLWRPISVAQGRTPLRLSLPNPASPSIWLSQAWVPPWTQTP